MIGPAGRREGSLTDLLEKAFAQAARLPEAEQDTLAAWLLAELESEEAFDEAIARSAPKLERMVLDVIAEDEAGLTEELDPKKL